MTLLRSDGRVSGRDNGFGHQQKLTPAQRTEIGYRRMEGETAKSLAVEYGVSASLVNTIPKAERPL
jgi:hypothetical protein